MTTAPVVGFPAIHAGIPLALFHLGPRPSAPGTTPHYIPSLSVGKLREDPVVNIPA